MGTRRTGRQDLLPGTLDMLILKSLTRSVMHGSGIAEHIRRLSDDVLSVEEGSLYPALQRLQIQGWIASQWGHSVNNRRARYYRLTPAGRRQLAAAESNFARLIQAITRVMKPNRTPNAG
jgi:transcriptional regulator